MSNITRIPVTTPFNQAISELLDNDQYLEALIENLDFNTNNIDQIYTALGMEKQFQLDLSLGHTLGTYTDWTHFDAETGYSIWKYPVSNFKDNVANQMFFHGPDDDDGVLLTYMGESDVESQTYFDYVYRYDGNAGTPTYADLTAAAQNEGSSSEFMADTDDYLYLGFSSKFSKATFELGTLGTGLNISSNVEYWQTGTTPAWASVAGLSDGTLNMAQNGTISFTEPADWGTTAVNGQTKYWIRISTSTSPIGSPYFKTVTRGNAVADLLLMTGQEFQDADWRWCYFNDYVYVCIKNDSTSTAYEGVEYITSTSIDTIKRSFFITNHEYTVNHEKTTYSSGLSLTFTDELVIDLSAKLDATANDFIRLIPGNSLTTAEIRLDHNDADAVTTKLSIMRLNSDATPAWEYADIHCQDIYAEGNVYSGDLKFNNGMYFTEDGNELVLCNKDNKEIFRITHDGDLKISGEIVS